MKRAMKERGIGFKEAVNEGIRHGLGAPRTDVDLVFPAFDMGTPFVDLTQADRVADALEDEALMQKLAEGR